MSVNVIDCFIGKTFTSIVGLEKESDQVFFTTKCGKTYEMVHIQECCESVYIDYIVGDVEDIIESPIKRAEELTNHHDCFPDPTHTWTFYRLETDKGEITIKWYGTSNGYYSEQVDIFDISAKH